MLTPVSHSLRAVAGLAVAATLFCAPGQAATTLGAQPSGVMTAQLAVGTHPLSFPLVRSEVFAGIVSTNTSTTITFEEGDVAAALVAGEKYYLEVVSGPMEGDRFDLRSASGSEVALDLTAASHSTVSSLGSIDLSGAHVAVRQHVTLKNLARMFTPALVGHNNAALADQVHLYKNGGLFIFHLRGDGLSWREPGRAVDQRDYVIPPDSSILVTLKSGPKQWVHSGAVRANAFRVNLVAGTRTFATGFPIDLSFEDIGAWTDAQQPAGARWVGGANTATADTFQIYSPSTKSFLAYHLDSDGTSWRPNGGGSNVAGDELLAGRSMLLVKRTNADADYFILRPYSL